MIDLDKPRTRKEAIADGLHKYFTGKPCRKGHYTFRYTNTGACGGCIAGYARHYRAQHKLYPNRISVTYTVNKTDKEILDNFVVALNMARKIQEGS